MRALISLLLLQAQLAAGSTLQAVGETLTSAVRPWPDSGAVGPIESPTLLLGQGSAGSELVGPCLACPAGSCQGNFSSLPGPSRVHAVATALDAAVDSCLWLEAGDFLPADTELTCATLALPANHTVEAGQPLWIGGVSQLYRLDVQLAIAVFQGMVPPLVGPAVACAAILAGSTFRACREGTALSRFVYQSGLAKNAFLGGMLGGAVQTLAELVTTFKTPEEVDLVRAFGVVLQLAFAYMTFSGRTNCLTYFSGMRIMGYAGKTWCAGLAAYGATGNVFAGAMLLQPLLVRRATEQRDATWTSAEVTRSERRP